MTLQHRVTLTLDPAVLSRLDRLADVLESIRDTLRDDGLSGDEEQAVLNRARGQADRLHTITEEPPVK